MSIQVTWADERETIIYAQFGESWTLEEFHDCVDQMYAMVTSVGHDVHFISDFTISRSSPAKLLSTGRHIENKKAPNSGINVIVGANQFVKAMLQVAEKMFLTGMNIKLAGTLDEAYAIIEQHESKTER